MSNKSMIKIAISILIGLLLGCIILTNTLAIDMNTLRIHKYTRIINDIKSIIETDNMDKVKLYKIIEYKYADSGPIIKVNNLNSVVSSRASADIVTNHIHESEHLLPGSMSFLFLMDLHDAPRWIVKVNTMKELKKYVKKYPYLFNGGITTYDKKIEDEYSGSLNNPNCQLQFYERTAYTAEKHSKLREINREKWLKIIYKLEKKVEYAEQRYYGHSPSDEALILYNTRRSLENDRLVVDTHNREVYIYNIEHDTLNSDYTYIFEDEIEEIVKRWNKLEKGERLTEDILEQWIIEIRTRD